MSTDYLRALDDRARGLWTDLAALLQQGKDDGRIAFDLSSPYIVFRDLALRERVTLLEQDIINAIQALTHDSMSQLVEDICTAKWDENRRLHIGHALYLEVILPVLAEGHRQYGMPYARWLALSQQWNLRDDRAAKKVLGVKEFDASVYLRETLAADPNDDRIAQALMGQLAENIDYAFHELPEILIGDLDETEAELAELEGLIGRYGEELFLSAWQRCESWQDQRKEWRYHCKNYRRFQECRSDYLCYAEFLKRSGQP